MFHWGWPTGDIPPSSVSWNNSIRKNSLIDYLIVLRYSCVSQRADKCLSFLYSRILRIVSCSLLPSTDDQRILKYYCEHMDLNTYGVFSSITVIFPRVAQTFLSLSSKGNQLASELFLRWPCFQGRLKEWEEDAGETRCYAMVSHPDMRRVTGSHGRDVSTGWVEREAERTHGRISQTFGWGRDGAGLDQRWRQGRREAGCLGRCFLGAPRAPVLRKLFPKFWFFNMVLKRFIDMLRLNRCDSRENPRLVGSLHWTNSSEIESKAHYPFP